MKKVLILMMICLLFALSFLAVGAKPFHYSRLDNNKYAVVIGLNGSQPKVTGANCARLSVDILRDAGFSNKNIKLITSNKATRQTVFGALDWLMSVETSDSEIVLGFFGHGGAVGFALADGAITHAEIRDLAPVVSQKQLIIIDSCGSGGAIIEGMDGVTLSAPNRIVITSVTSESGSSVVNGRYPDWTISFLLKGIK